MKKLILIVLVMSMQLMGDANFAQMNARVVEGVAEIRLRIHSQMYSIKQARKQNVKQEYIAHVEFMHEGRVLFDVKTSPNVSRNPIFKFNINNFLKDEVFDVLLTDNFGIQTRQSFKMEFKGKGTDGLTDRFSGRTIMEVIEINPTLKRSKEWDITTVDSSIQELYGQIENTIDKNIEVKIPEVAACSYDIPINISSDIDLESIAVFTDKVSHPTIAVFTIPKGAVINYDFRIKIETVDGTGFSTIVVGKSRDGKFYKITEKRLVGLTYDGCM